MGTASNRELPPAITTPDGEVLTVYHMGRTAVEYFAPFTHFGTLNAAFERLIQKDVLPQGNSEDIYLNGTVFYPVHLRLKNPLVVEDDFTWAANGINAATARHLSRPELAYLDEVRAMPDHKVNAELAQGQIYDISDKSDDNRQHLVSQRIISVLESRGYDGIAYINRDEDIGSVSWVNFRSQQVEGVYSGRMTNQPCLVLPSRPQTRLESISAVFSGRNAPETAGLSDLQDAHWVTPPETVLDIVDHFAYLQSQWIADQKLQIQQFEAIIAVAGYDPEYVAARVASGDGNIDHFYENCRKRMAELASAPEQDVPEWQRSYLPEIRRLAKDISAHSLAISRSQAGPTGTCRWQTAPSR